MRRRWRLALRFRRHKRPGQALRPGGRERISDVTCGRSYTAASAEEVHVARTDDLAGGALAFLVSQPANNDDGDALVGLAHEERRGACDFIGQADDGRLQLVAIEIAAAALVLQRSQASR